jgi:hypothetical protein
MNRICVLIVVCWLSTVVARPAVVFGAAYSSKALIDNAKVLDGKKVVYRGEAVTAIMKRGEYAWVNVNDGDNAIGIWCKGYKLAPVQYLGGYKFTGDTLEVEGMFNRACSMHGGELDIHANKIRILKTGSAVSDSANLRKLALAVVLLLATIAVTVIFRKRV